MKFKLFLFTLVLLSLIPVMLIGYGVGIVARMAHVGFGAGYATFDVCFLKLLVRTKKERLP